MRKLGKILWIYLLLLLISPIKSFSAGSVDVDWTYITRDVGYITFSWTADSGDGSVPSTASMNIQGYVILVVTDPGTPAPTDNYDITLTDENGVDVMGGTLANRDASNTEQAVPKIGNVYGGRWVSGTVTLNISNNSVGGAKGIVKVYIER